MLKRKISYSASFKKNLKKKRMTFTVMPIVAAFSALCGYYVSPETAVKGPVLWRMCFTPGEPCLPLIIDALQKARRTIDVQAYTLTSKSIAQSLVDAKRRGVRVRVLVDKSQQTNPYSQLHALKKGRLEIRIDYRPAIAHNKVMIIDHKKTLTGSYNWTEGAERRNAENLLLIENKNIARMYGLNFEKRWAVSLPLGKQVGKQKSKKRGFLTLLFGRKNTK